MIRWTLSKNLFHDLLKEYQNTKNTSSHTDLPTLNSYSTNYKVYKLQYVPSISSNYNNININSSTHT